MWKTMVASVGERLNLEDFLMLMSVVWLSFVSLYGSIQVTGRTSK